jgi:hypothetical protein
VIKPQVHLTLDARQGTPCPSACSLWEHLRPGRRQIAMAIDIGDALDTAGTDLIRPLAAVRPFSFGPTCFPPDREWPCNWYHGKKRWPWPPPIEPPTRGKARCGAWRTPLGRSLNRGNQLARTLKSKSVMWARGANQTSGWPRLNRPVRTSRHAGGESGSATKAHPASPDWRQQ